jgi:methylthioribose-1-phosphate isomerase
MSGSENTLEAIKFDEKTVSLNILDQLVLPYTTKYISIATVTDAFNAIKSMQVRGAPAIAIVASLALVVDVHSHVQAADPSYTIEKLQSLIEYLISSRPTAVNLANALNDISAIISHHKGIVDKSVYDLIYDYSIRLFRDDLANNYKIGANGVDYIVDSLTKEQFTGPFSIITICNTGSLATSGHGTALGIIRSAYESLSQSKSSHPFYLDHIYPCETRPYNQGAKLTTYELDYEKIPFTLICDNMASSLIRSLNNSIEIKNSSAPVKFIIVGADRIVKNGDTANKIGTFQLATIANYFNTTTNNKIRFIVAAPKTTIDLNTPTGSEIVIEERPAKELTTLNGPILTGDDAGDKITVGIATPGISVWNPAFDVTPHELIDSIVTEDKTVFVKDESGTFHLNRD